MDVKREADKVAALATYFVWVGWFFVIYAVIAGVIWWIDLASRESINVFEAFAASAAAVAVPIFIALAVAMMGHSIRLFALYVSSRS